MNTITFITASERRELEDLHQQIGDKITIVGCSTVAAAFLLMGALMVIACASLCFTLPGVNALTDIILPAYAPSFSAIIVSIPFILFAVKHNRDKNYLYKVMIDKTIDHLENYRVPEMSRSLRVKFILANALRWRPDPHQGGKLLKNTNWTDFYQNQVINELKEKMGLDKKDRNPRQEKITTALDKTLAKIPNRKK